jgi:hypothetical protein
MPLPPKIGGDGEGVEPRHAAALAKQHHRIAGQAAIAVGDERLRGFVVDQQAEGAARDPVAFKDGILDGDKRIDVFARAVRMSAAIWS